MTWRLHDAKPVFPIASTSAVLRNSRQSYSTTKNSESRGYVVSSIALQEHVPPSVEGQYLMTLWLLPLTPAEDFDARHALP